METTAQSKKTILVIEDDRVLGDVMIEKLNRAGYDSHLERDGKTGLAAVVRIKPDLILLDIVLPTMNGYEILEALRETKDVSAIPVIIISNSGQPVEISRALELGVKDYVVKAMFSPDEVLKKVEEQLIRASPNRKAEHTGLSIVLVEDDPLLSTLFTTKMSSEGFVVHHAEDGSSAMEKVRSAKPDIVILDVILPGMDGFEVLEALKKDPETKNIPVIMLSNIGQSAERKRGEELGAAAFLIKANVSISEVITQIEAVLDKEKAAGH